VIPGEPCPFHPGGEPTTIVLQSVGGRERRSKEAKMGRDSKVRICLTILFAIGFVGSACTSRNPNQEKEGNAAFKVPSHPRHDFEQRKRRWRNDLEVLRAERADETIEVFNHGHYLDLDACKNDCSAARAKCLGSPGDGSWCVPTCDADSDCLFGYVCICKDKRNCRGLEGHGVMRTPTEYWSNVCQVCMRDFYIDPPCD